MTAACVLFGIALILNVHPVGDGLWFWYAVAIRQHQHLYSDLHVNQQPFFFLASAAFQQVFGIGWLASKILALVQLLLFCVGLWQVSRFVPWRAWQRALLIAAAFAMAITSPFYRFDDYHVTTQCLQLFAIVLLLKLAQGVSRGAELSVAAGIGALCGLAIGNRLNVGAGLAVACGLALLVLARRKLIAVPAFVACTAISLILLIKLTGDPLSAWWLETVTHAARIKGGTGSVLHAALSFPLRVAQAALQPKGLLLLVAIVSTMALFARYPQALRRGARLRSGRDWLIAAWLLLLEALLFWQGTRNLANAKLGQFGVLFAVAVGLWVHWFILRRLLAPAAQQGNRLQVLLLIPFWALIAAAMTSGIYLPDYESHVALLLLLVPIAMPVPFDRQWQRRGWLVLASMIVVAALPAKTLVPYSWHHYHAEPLFRDRVWYRHPVYGPMLIERAQLDFMLPLCAAVQADGPQVTLLATPYPYPNYFCAVPSWHGYVQTWYDTASRQQIEGLEHALAQAPPRWIAYQRGLDTLALHEQAYNAGRPLAHRDLDTQMMANVTADRWTVVQRECFSGSDWMLLRTTPPAPGEHQGTPADADDRAATCKASEHDRGQGRF